VQSEQEFDRSLLKNELLVLHGSGYVKGKSPHEGLQWSHDSSMANTFEQTYKLGDPISAIQVTIASAGRGFSALRRVKTHLRSSRIQDKNKFKLALKRYLLRNSFYHLEEYVNT
jgi:hypothetical protein